METKRRVGIIFFALLVIGCNQAELKKNKITNHLAKISYPVNKELYIDSVSNKSVLKLLYSDTADYRFSSFRIGFSDSTVNDKKEEIQVNKYFDYEMQNEWVALIEGDSVNPVLIQPLIRKHTFQREFLIVFEVKKNARIDTLIYKNTFSKGSILQIPLYR